MEKREYFGAHSLRIGALQCMFLALVMMLLAPGRAWAYDDDDEVDEVETAKPFDAMLKGTFYHQDRTIGAKDDSLGFVFCSRAIEGLTFYQLYDPVFTLSDSEGSIASYKIEDFKSMEGDSVTFTTAKYGKITFKMSLYKVVNTVSESSIWNRINVSLGKIPSGSKFTLRLKYTAKGLLYTANVATEVKAKITTDEVTLKDVTPTFTEESYGKIKVDYGSACGTGRFQGVSDTTYIFTGTPQTISRPEYRKAHAFLTTATDGFLYQTSAATVYIPTYCYPRDITVDPHRWTKKTVISWNKGVDDDRAKSDGYWGIVLATDDKKTCTYIDKISASKTSYTHETGDLVNYGAGYKYFIFYIPKEWGDKITSSNWTSYCNTEDGNISAWSDNFKYDNTFNITLSGSQDGKLTWSCPDIGENNDKAGSCNFEIMRATYNEDTNTSGDFARIATQSASASKEYQATLSSSDSYVYRIDISNILGSTMSSNTCGPLISDTYPHVTSLTATKGMLGGSVHLEWTTAQNTDETVKYVLSRRGIGVQGQQSQSRWTTIYTTTGTASRYVYNDQTAVNGVYYEYKIESTIESSGKRPTTLTDIGFPTHTGQISGNINFEGGTAVEKVKVKMTPIDENGGAISTYALPVGGKGNGLLWQPGMDEFNSRFKSQGRYKWTEQMFILPDTTNQNGAEILQIGNSIFRLGTYNRETKTYPLIYNDTAIPDVTLQADRYSSVTFAYDGEKLTTTVKSKQRNTSAEIFTQKSTLAVAFVTPTNADVCVGAAVDATNAVGFHGYIDDVRLYGGAALTDDEIDDIYNHYLSGSEKNLVAYWPMDEGIQGQTMAYDYSRTSGEPNGNHATILKNQSLSNCVPDDDMLGLLGYTGKDGSYTVSAINYFGAGTTYRVTPTKGIHTFDPVSVTRLFNSGNSNHNGVDFKDNSSFPVSGNVYFANTDVPVSDCQIYVDGQPVSKDGEMVMTNSLGEYSFNVAIGKHTISVKKDGHEFLNGGKYTSDFYDEMKNLLFTDVTTVHVVGRVCGGEVQNSYGYGLCLSTNNIGKARVVLSVDSRYNLNAANTGDGTVDAASDRTFLLGNDTSTDGYSRSVSAKTCDKPVVKVGDKNHDHSHLILYTDSVTGEFSAMLPPMQYAVDSVVIINDGDGLNKNYFENLKYNAIDASKATVTNTDSIINADSTAYIRCKYNAAFEMTTYQSDNSVDIVQTNPAPDNGSEHMFGMHSDTYTAGRQEETLQFYNGNTYNYKYPIFKKLNSYTFHVSGYQTYNNYDADRTKPVVDKMWMKDAQVMFNNGMAASCYAVDSVSGKPIMKSQDYVTLNDQGQADYIFTVGFPNITESEGFTKAVDVTIRYGSKATKWECTYANAKDKVFYGIVLGSIPLGSDFITAGPDRVTMVLRDPPGSQSFATWCKGSTVSTTYTYTNNVTTSDGKSCDANTSPEITTSIGIGAEVELTISPKVESVGSKFNTNITGTSNSKTFSVTTTADVSTSDNKEFDGPDADIFIGTSTNTIIGQSRNVNFFKENGEWKLALRTQTSFGEKFSTLFNYTRHFIEKTLIPNYNRLANELESRNYTPTSVKNADGVEISKVDSVAMLRDNVVKWQKQLAFDECDKVYAIDQGEPYVIENISFDGGSTVSRSYENDSTFTKNADQTHIIDKETTTTLGIKVNDVGVYSSITLKSSSESKTGGSSEQVTKNCFSYTLKDTGVNDNLSVDVLKSHEGWSPIFRTRAGTTSGYWEPERTTNYLEDASKKGWSKISYSGERVIMAATKKLNVPVLTTVNNQKDFINNPAGSTVKVPLILKNNSEKDGSSAYFKLMLDGLSNDENMIVTCNGSPLSQGVIYNLAALKADTVDISVEQSDISVSQADLTIKLVDMEQMEDVGTFAPNDSSLNIHLEFTETSSPVTLTPKSFFCNGTTEGGKVQMTLSGYQLGVTNLAQIGFEYWEPGATDWSTQRKVWNIRNKAIEMADGTTTTENSFSFDFDLLQLSDGEYKVRAFTMAQPSGTPVYAYSDIMTITKDTSAPQAIGSTSPGNGIYTGVEPVSITFNEDIVNGALNKSNVRLRGNLDNNTSSHEVSLYCIGNSMNTESKLNVLNGEGSINMYIKRETKGGGQNDNSILLSKASESGNKFSIQLDNDGHLILNMGGTTITSTNAIPLDEWAFLNIAAKKGKLEAKYVTANDNAGVSLISVEQDDFTLNTGSTGRISVGKNFVGYIHGMAIWDKFRDFDTATSEQNNTLTEFTSNLKAYWPMNRGYGLTAEEIVNNNNIVLNNENEWHIERKAGNENYSLSCSPSQRYDISLGDTFVTDDDDDFTLQFWFAGNVSQNIDAVIYGYKNTYLKYSNLTGKLTQHCGNASYLVGDESYKTNAWHTFTMTVNKSKKGNAIIYIDGQSKITFPASEVDNMGGILKFGGDFYGNIDEIRVWNGIMDATTIQTTMHEKLNPSVVGNALALYLPFDETLVNSAGQDSTVFSLKDQAIHNNLPASAIPVMYGEYTGDITGTTAIVPPVKSATKMSDVAFDIVTSERTVQLNITEADKNIQGRRLYAIINGVTDMAGNTSSAITWNFLVNLNKVAWSDSSIVASAKDMTTALDVVSVVNKTSTEQSWYIDNIPSWMTVSDTHGSVQGYASKTIVISYTANVPMGVTNGYITLHETQTGFSKPLYYTTYRAYNEPEWSVTGQYQNTMSVIGQVVMDSVKQENIYSKIGVFDADDNCVGVASPDYQERVGAYYYSLTIYGNETGTTPLKFKYYDANSGLTHPDITGTPVLTFTPDGVVGSYHSPYIWTAGDNVEHTQTMDNSYKLFSINVVPTDPSINNVLPATGVHGNILPKGTQVWEQDGFSTFDGTAWTGAVTTIEAGKSYMWYPAQDATGSYTFKAVGKLASEARQKLTIHNGWNWLGANVTSSVYLKNAFADMDCQEGDFLKNHYVFASYEQGGWIGYLKYIMAGQGYKYRSMATGNKQFTFPTSSALSGSAYASKAKTLGSQLSALTSTGSAQASLHYGGADVYKYSDAMAVTCVLKNGSQIISNAEIAAFDQSGELRGENVTDDSTNRHLVYLYVHGDDAESLSFKAVVGNGTDAKVYDLSETFLFSGSTAKGTIDNPVVFDLSATGVKNVDADVDADANAKVYTVGGAKIRKADAHGVYINNGRKYTK